MVKISKSKKTLEVSQSLAKFHNKIFDDKNIQIEEKSSVPQGSSKFSRTNEEFKQTSDGNNSKIDFDDGMNKYFFGDSY
jgi:hypothetical protein